MAYNTSKFETEIQKKLDAVSSTTPYEELAYLAKIEALQDDPVYVPRRTLLQKKTYTASNAAERLPKNCNIVKIWATAKGGKSTGYGSGGGGGSVNGFEMEVVVGSTLAITYGTSHVINNLAINEPLPASLYNGQLGGAVMFNGVVSSNPTARNGGNGKYSRSGYPALNSGHDVTIASGITFSQGGLGNRSTDYGGGASGTSNGVDGDKRALPTQYGAGAGMGYYAGKTASMGSHSNIVIEFYQVK